MSNWEQFLCFVGLIVVSMIGAGAIIGVAHLLMTLVDHVRYGRHALAERKTLLASYEAAKSNVTSLVAENEGLRAELRKAREHADPRGSYREEPASLTPTPPPPSGEHDQFPSRALAALITENARGA